jgi:hypothetical protein
MAYSSCGHQQSKGNHMSKRKKYSPVCRIPPPFFFDGTWTGDSYCIFNVNEVMCHVAMGTKYIGAIQSRRPFVVQNHGTKNEQFDFGTDDRPPSTPRVKDIIVQYAFPNKLALTNVILNNPFDDDQCFRMLKLDRPMTTRRKDWLIDVIFVNDIYTPLLGRYSSRCDGLDSAVQLYKNDTDDETVAVIMPLYSPVEGVSLEAMETMKGIIYEKSAADASA